MLLETHFQSAFCFAAIGSPDCVLYLICLTIRLLSIRSSSDEEIESLVFLVDDHGRKLGFGWTVSTIH